METIDEFWVFLQEWLEHFRVDGVSCIRFVFAFV
jgi:hypothetical protein